MLKGAHVPCGRPAIVRRPKYGLFYLCFAGQIALWGSTQPNLRSKHVSDQNQSKGFHDHHDLELVRDPRPRADVPSDSILTGQAVEAFTKWVKDGSRDTKKTITCDRPMEYLSTPYVGFSSADSSPRLAMSSSNHAMSGTDIQEEEPTTPTVNDSGSPPSQQTLPTSVDPGAALQTIVHAVLQHVSRVANHYEGILDECNSQDMQRDLHAKIEQDVQGETALGLAQSTQKDDLGRALDDVVAHWLHKQDQSPPSTNLSFSTIIVNVKCKLLRDMETQIEDYSLRKDMVTATA